MVPRVGQKIGPYEILGRLGSGGMGLVFSAWDSRLQRDVAIKLLREEFATPGMRQRFLQEARAASRLNHANICTIFDIGEQEGDPYLVMELLKGETIRTRITRGGVSPEDLLAVGIEVADALIVAHGRGIIHRDIKPANIILVEKVNGFQTKVLDFGLAKVEDSLDATKHDLTSAGTTVGTVAYMSPEQAKGEALDARSDLFSLGVVLYEMATGELPFQGATSALVFVQLLGHNPAPIRDFNPDIPKELDRAIMKLLEKKRTDRYQSASDTVDALRKITLKGGAAKSFWGSKPAKAPSAPPKREVEVRGSSGTVESSKWGVLGRNSDANEAPGFSQADKSKPPVDAGARRSDSSEAFIRPVRRIVEPHGMTPKPESNPAFVPPVIPPPPLVAPPSPPPPVAAASVVPPPAFMPVTPAPPPLSPLESSGVHRVPPRGSSGMHRVEPVSPLGSSGAHTQARSSTVRPEIPERRSVPRPAVGRFKQPDLGSGEQRISRTRPVAQTTTGIYTYEDAEAARKPKEKTSSRKGLWIGLVVLLIVVAGAAFGWYQTHPAAPTADIPTSILLASLENQTGDTSLRGVFQAGLELELDQSPHLSVSGQAEMAQALKLSGSADTDEPDLELSLKAAKTIGVKNVAIGRLRTKSDAHGGPSQYVLLVEVYDVATGKQLGESSEVSPSREQIGDTVGQIASDMRSTLGETGDSIGKTSVPLAKEASGSLDAMQAFVDAEKAMGQNRIDDAMAAYLRAVTADSKFTQAYIALADIYRRQNAEVEAKNAAAAAQGNLNEGRTQQLAQASYDINATGDYGHAITTLEQLCAAYPGDVAAHVSLSLAYRLAGKFPESLSTAQTALKLAPFNVEARGNAELAMLAMGHPDQADTLEKQGQRNGQPLPGISLLIALLNSKNVGVPDPSAMMVKLADTASLAAVQDASGQFNAGLATWKDVVSQARGNSTGKLVSAANYALAHAALDHALEADCATGQGLAAQALATAAGPNATYSAGLAYALCGDVSDAQKALAALNSVYSQSVVATGYYVPNLSATIQLKQGDPVGALGTLQAAKGNDQLSLAPYLRGLIHLVGKEPALARNDFQVVIQNQGAISLVTPMAYPMAKLGVARAYDDAPNKTTGYRAFLNLWPNADATSPVVVEAKNSTK